MRSRLTSTVGRAFETTTPVTHQIYSGLRRCLPDRGGAFSRTPDSSADGTTDGMADGTTDVTTGSTTGSMTGLRRLSGDRGAVSLEQVLWFVASGVSVAVVAGVLWGRIREQAETPIEPPSAP